MAGRTLCGGRCRLAEWLPHWRINWKRDAVAALAVWAVLVPQSMAYATLAGVPPVYGLYAAIVGLVLYGLLGTGRELNVGPSSSVAVMSAATVAPLAAGDGETYLALSAAVALVDRAHSRRRRHRASRLRRRVHRAPGARRLLHRSRADDRRDAAPRATRHPCRHGRLLREGLGDPGRASERSAGGPPPSGSRRSSSCSCSRARTARPRVRSSPSSSASSSVARSTSRTRESRSSGRFRKRFPTLGLPDVPVPTTGASSGRAVGIALLAYAESIAAARKFALQRGYEVDANRELVALGAANIGAGLTQGFPIDASVSRTTVAARSGQRSQLAGLVNAGLVVVAIFVLGELLRRPSEGDARRDRHRRRPFAPEYR